MKYRDTLTMYVLLTYYTIAACVFVFVVILGFLFVCLFVCLLFVLFDLLFKFGYTASDMWMRTIAITKTQSASTSLWSSPTQQYKTCLTSRGALVGT